MLRKHIKKLSPWNHLLHATCYEQLRLDEERINCPYCRQLIEDITTVTRNKYEKYSTDDKSRIVEAAFKGDDWHQLASSLGINYKTAYTWIRRGRRPESKKGGLKPKILSDEEGKIILSWIEENPSMSLKEMKQRVLINFNKNVCQQTISNFLDMKLFTVKSLHHQPVTMNSIENKRKRAAYVNSLNDLIREGKQIVYIDETNFNLFTRKTQGRSRIGSRAVQVLPSCRGPNIHVIGAISANGVIRFDKKRGSFNSNAALEWVETVFEKWVEIGNSLNDLVIVCDNAPAHNKLQTIFEGTPIYLLRLGPYSPQLNPIEIIWSKLKCLVKSRLSIPRVVPPGVVEQRLQYLENVIDDALSEITQSDCARAVQHSSTFHIQAANLEDIPVGE